MVSRYAVHQLGELQMTLAELDGLIDYLDFSVASLIEQHERHIRDPLVIQSLYDSAHEMLGDVYETVLAQIDDTHILP